MLFSVIVPIYNSQKTLRNCIDSILAQTFSDFEIVVIDDGSTDNGLAVLNSYTDSRIKIYHFENAGVSVARQRGITLANGEYLIFVDSDDTINKGLLKNLNHTIDTFSNIDIIRYQSNLLGDRAYKDHDRYNYYSSPYTPSSGAQALRNWSISNKKYAVYWLFAFKRTLFFDIAFPSDLKCYEDVAVIPVLIAKAKKAITINYVGYNYTCNNSTSLTNTRNESAERSRALDFVKAYDYAISHFMAQKELSNSDRAFFIEDYNKRLREKFSSLSEDLKEEVYTLYNI